MAEPRLAAAQLVLVTRGAVAVDDSEPVAPDLAALCGLVRSAQAENPGQFLLVDTDDPATVTRHLPALRQLGAPETALRHGRLHTPRLIRLPAPPRPAPAPGRFPARTAKAPSWSPAPPAPSADWSPATWSPPTASGGSC
ncbi:hypothetical protein ACFQVA_41335 [Actinomadura keratinilytica]